MDMGKIGKPIVMAKPMRGREMQSTVIPKDVVDTVRAVSTKQIRGESIVENLQKPREGDVEVYHEGYVDGKLYLVPDTNLQAMRDIVNLKMKRRHSSAEKPQTSLNEPTQYTEFRSKLDSLLGKIDQLADSSVDESESVEGSERQKRRSKTKKSQDSKEKTDKPSTDISSLLQTKDKKKPTESALLDTTNKTTTKRVAIPPMMDENISYIRTRPKGAKRLERALKDTEDSGKGHEEKCRKGKFDYIEDQTHPKELTNETFKLLISGHLKNGAVPIFINHQNYTGPNILENETPDFKTHKKEGNIDIFIAGKFFTGNILKEESFESPAILDVKPQKIVIDKDYDVHRRKFKDIYKVGPLDVALEDNIALENMSTNQSPTTVLYSERNNETPFRQNQQKQPVSSKHVHYASGNKESSPNNFDSIKNKSSKDQSLFGKLKNIKVYKKLFSKNEENNHNDKSSENGLVSSSQQMRARTSKSRREELARLRRSRLKDRKATRGQNKKLFITSQEGHNASSQQVFKCDTKAQSPFETKGASITDKNSKGDPLNTKKVKKIRKEKKKDKNQAIVENPILAQMQEFFIA